MLYCGWRVLVDMCIMIDFLLEVSNGLYIIENKEPNFKYKHHRKFIVRQLNIGFLKILRNYKRF